MKVDSDTLEVLGTYDGLNRPYTYSDFTGNALFNVTCLPPECRGRASEEPQSPPAFDPEQRYPG